jgi:hypothetical protein
MNKETEMIVTIEEFSRMTMKNIELSSWVRAVVDLADNKYKTEQQISIGRGMIEGMRESLEKK